MRFFYFLARNISYTFAVSFFTVIIAWIVAVFGFFLGTSFITFSYEKMIPVFLRWLPVAVVIVTFMHYVQFGFLTPLRVPAILKSHRRINKAFKSSFNVGTEEMRGLFNYFTNLPMQNLITSAFYTAIVGFIIIGAMFYEYKFSGSITIAEVKLINRIVGLSVLITMILYGMATYLLTEALTSNERAMTYNELVRNGVKIHPESLIGIRMKFFFFIVLLVITLFTFAAFMEKTRYDVEFEPGWVITYFLISVVAAFYLMQVTISSILKVLNDMRRVTKEIAAGGQAGFKVLSLEKEFASIQYALMEMSWEIDDHRKNLETMVEQRTKELQDALTDLRGRDSQIQKQLDMASVIQRSILPGQIEDWNELKFAVRYIAMEKIGGDFYDIHQLKDDKLGIMIADVSGHGIPAALVTTMAKISFGNAGARFDSPKQIFQEVNQNILDHVKTQDYMTCFMVAVDDEYNVVYANASHQKAVLLRTEAAEVELLDTSGLFIGAVEEARDTYDEGITRLEYSDRLVLYTDGIPEALNEKRKEYSNKRLERVILENRHLPLDEFADHIIKDVQEYIGHARVEDDITLLVIELARDEAIDTIKRSRKLIASHEYYQAIEMLEEAMIKFPDNQKILYNLAKNYFRVNDYNKCIETMEKYLDHDKRNKYAFYIAGAACYQIMDFDSAAKNFERAVDLDSHFVNALFGLGMTHKKSNDMEKAERTFNRVIDIDSDNKKALFELKLIKEADEQATDKESLPE